MKTISLLFMGPEAEHLRSRQIRPSVWWGCFLIDRAHVAKGQTNFFTRVTVCMSYFCIVVSKLSDIQSRKTDLFQLFVSEASVHRGELYCVWTTWAAWCEGYTGAVHPGSRENETRTGYTLQGHPSPDTLPHWLISSSYMPYLQNFLPSPKIVPPTGEHMFIV